MNRHALSLALGAALALAAAGCETPRESRVPEMIPAGWEGRENPLPNSPETVARGQALFEKNCTPCHGIGADGKGPASAGLDPPPANFHDGKRLAMHSDAYLFWRITTGKKDTAMPAFEGTLSDDERWAILRYLRSLEGT